MTIAGVMLTGIGSTNIVLVKVHHLGIRHRQNLIIVSVHGSVWYDSVIWSSVAYWYGTIRPIPGGMRCYRKPWS